MNLKDIFCNVNEPARLQKPQIKKDIMNKLNSFIEKNFNLIVLASIIFLLLVFVICCFILMGVSTTDSGTYYYGLKGVI